MDYTCKVKTSHDNKPLYGTLENNTIFINNIFLFLKN